MIAGADVAVAIGQRDLAAVDRAAPVLLAAGDEHIVDAAVDIERAQRPRLRVLARPRDALGRTVGGAGLATQAEPRVLEVGAAAVEGGQAAEKADLVGVGRGVEVAAQDLRGAGIGALGADRGVDREDLTLARDAIVEAIMEVRGVDPDRTAVGGDLRGEENPRVGGARIGERDRARVRDRLRDDREALLAGGELAVRAVVPAHSDGVVRGVTEGLGDHVGGGTTGAPVEWTDLLEADHVGGKCAKLPDRERETLIERRLGAPEVQRDDAEVRTHAVSVSGAAIDTARREGLGDHDLDKTGQPGRELCPPPHGEQLARGIGEALDFVQHLMIEPLDQRLSVLVDLGEVHDPAALGIDLALDHDLDRIAVAVHPGAFVPHRHLREEVCRFEPVAPLEASPHGRRFVAHPRMLGKPRAP